MVSALIFVATLALVIWQPKGLGIGWTACGGALLSLLLGTVALGDVPKVWSIVWNASGTLIGLIVITLVLDRSGLFRWCALWIARAAGGSGPKLFALVVLLGAAMSAFLANDGAVLILTPVVMALLDALRFPLAARIAFVMAAGFIVDSASLPFVSSNLVNIISADFCGAEFIEYARVMVPVDLASVAASLAVLWAVFRRSVPKRFDPAALPDPESAILIPSVFRIGWSVLALQLGFCLASSFLGIPVSAITCCCALVLLASARTSGKADVGSILRGAPWHIVFFSLGMYLVVYGLRNEGWMDGLASSLSALAGSGEGAAAFGTGFIAAFLSSVMNNLPATMTGTLAIDASGAEGTLRGIMFYANAIGCDLGPKITPIGSLATLLWLSVLSHKGLRITWGYYMRIGIVLTLPVLAAALGALVLVA